MNQFFNLFIFIWSSSFFLFSQNPDRKFVSFSVSSNKIEVQVSDGTYRIGFYSPQIVETSFFPEGEILYQSSHTVEVSFIHLNDYTFTENENHIILNNPKLNDASSISVFIQKNPFQIIYKSGKSTIISEKLGYIRNTDGEVLQFNLTEKESLFGGGARALGMNRRGNNLKLYNKAHYAYEDRSELMNFSMPIVISSKCYLIHFDNPSVGSLDLDSRKQNTLEYELSSGRKTYQVVIGKTWEKLISNYTYLTGRQPLPPRWVFGNFASRFGYHSQREVELVVDKFREDSIALDAIILDLYWFGKTIQGTLGNLEFYRDSFPEPEKMIQKLQQNQVKTILITEPFILSSSKRWNEAIEKDILAKDKLGNPYQYDFYFGNTGLIDIYKPDANRWFWNIYFDLKKLGVAGFWGDLGEPEVHPEDLQHFLGSANKFHNIYGHDWARLIFDGYKRNFSNERPFILMRAGYSGSQRFGMIPWSGDVNRSWGGLKSQLEISLQMGLQGMAYMHSDLGGFAGSYEDDELYIRWLQYGVFQPIFRPHAQEELASEPIFKKPETKKIVKEAIDLRYKMLPYNYTLAYQNSKTGVPFMRPLFFEEPLNEFLYTKDDTYLWGNNFLVAPILIQSQKEKEVYFPKNSNWFDFYSGVKYEGGSTASILTNIENIPIFVRGGAFIPLIKEKIQSTEQYSFKDIEVHYFFDSELIYSDGILYHDDGKTPISNENVKIVTFSSTKKGKKIRFNTNVEENNNEQIKSIRFVIHGLNKENYKITGKNIEYKFENLSSTLNVHLNIKGSQNNFFRLIIK
jgi:oligosaccharide 4-alpha-D-glucosyltransferase